MKLFGWRGISLSVPEDWDIVFVGGNEGSGYLSLGGSSGIKQEIKWTQSKGKYTPLKILKGFIDKIEKNAKAKGHAFESLIDTKMVKRDGVISFEWTAGQLKAFGAVYLCAKCRRIVLSQVLNESKQKSFGLLSKLKCHETGFWNVYWLELNLPEDMVLKEHIFKSGFIKLVFLTPFGKLTVERWGMASNILDGRSLSEWFRYAYKDSVKKMGFEFESVRLSAHEGLKITIKKKALIEKILRIKKPFTEGFCWHCPASNKVFYVHTESVTSHEETLAKIAGSIKCH